MDEDNLFDELDFDGDGKLTREEVHHAAMRFGWQWQQASLFAFLDYMTIRAPLEREDFISCMVRINQDPDGPYGEVLQKGPLFSNMRDCGTGEVGGKPTNNSPLQIAGGIEKIISGLEYDNADEDFRAALERLGSPSVRLFADEAAVLLIDPQRSFTAGSWKHTLGPDGDREVMPIQAAFENCADLLRMLYRHTDVMFTRCPFPPGSYEWDERFEGIIDPDQLYFIKPGNSVLYPTTNGCREWVECMIGRGKKKLVMGGCTLNSCVRVSSLETLAAFRDKGLEVIVDLGLCGARASNYGNSPQFGGASAVEAAMKQMSGEGVKVAERVEWIQGRYWTQTDCCQRPPGVYSSTLGVLKESGK
jgi:hypothetical protein